MNQTDFQLPAPMAARRIVVAMSGGVDSSVVAGLAHASGAETIGITLRLYDGESTIRRKGACCAGDDIRDAVAVADRLGFAHHVIDHESEFREAVIDQFADEYLAGRTPIPCVQCNMGPKFSSLLGIARQLGADCLATGHYVRRKIGAAGSELHRAIDTARDQSYFLFATTQDQLDFLRFPLGGMPKDEVRRVAASLGLGVANKPDSQDICFVPDGNYARIVTAVRPEAEEPGEIVGLDGHVIGHHRGIIHFTVGQRRGLDIGGQAEPLYVIRIDAASRRVIVGPKRALAVQAAKLSGLNWLADPNEIVGPIMAKVRSMAKPVPVRIADDTLRFDTAEYGVAPGQAAVLYAGDRVIGGGWIDETEPAALEPA
jgi:tRNA-uridine 2-sulfurtransferase